MLLERSVTFDYGDDLGGLNISTYPQFIPGETAACEASPVEFLQPVKH